MDLPLGINKQHFPLQGEFFPPRLQLIAYPDENSAFSQYRYSEVQNLFRTFGGIVHIRLTRSEIRAPQRLRFSGSIIANDQIVPSPLYSSTNYRNPFWEIELAYARKFSSNFQAGIRIIPYSRRIIPDFYNLIPFSYTDTDLLSSAGYHQIQVGMVSQLSHRLRLGISLNWEQYRWKANHLLSRKWHFSQLAFNALSDLRVSRHGILRLWFRLQHPEMDAPTLNTSFIPSARNNFITLAPQSAIHTLAISYAYQQEHISLNIALVNDWGTLTQTRFYAYETPLGTTYPKYSERIEVVNSYLTAGISLTIHPQFAVQSGMVLGGKGYTRPGVFETTHTTSITRAPTLGFSWYPTSHWEVTATLLPRNGFDIVNSTKNNENFYQASLRYYWK